MALTNNLFQDEHGVFFPPRDPNEIKREEEAEAKRIEQEAAALQVAADIQVLCDRIDAAMEPYLKEHLAAENSRARITRAAKRDFEKFKTYCAKYDPALPHLPAAPQAVAAFLCGGLAHGAAHVSRLCRSISTIHRALGFADPADDVLVRAIMGRARLEKKAPSQKGN